MAATAKCRLRRLGAGISQITAKTVDFGASDGPLTSAQATACGQCEEIPWALASTGLSYNLPGVSKLQLSGPVVADIFLGTITNWDSPKIKALNPHVKLPNLVITPVHRSDGSGDTYAFTHYLSSVSKTWASHVGYATAVNWPAGTGGNGNSGVAAIVTATKGAIGNNSWFYIHDDKLQPVAIENNADKFIYPFVKNVTDAANAILGHSAPYLGVLSGGNASTVANALSIVDAPYTKPKLVTKKVHGKTVKKPAKLTPLQKEEANAYPMSTFTYVIVRPDANDISLLQQFIEFAITPAEEAKGAALQFAPLPSAVYKQDEAAAKRL